MSKVLAVPERTIESRSYLTFRCRLKSDIGSDVHRAFSGSYYPRWRSIYLDEVREVRGQVKLFPVFDLAVMYKADGDYFMPSDFAVGVELFLGKSEFSRDDAAKTFVITWIDDSHLHGWTIGAPRLREKRDAACPVPLVRVRDALLQRSGSVPQAIKDAGKWFRSPQADGRRMVVRDTFAAMCKDLQVGLSPSEVSAVFDAFDANDDGAVSFEEFVTALRGPMSEARERIIAAAFAKVDADRDGIVSPMELGAAFRASAHPDVLSGAVTEAQALNGFLAVWDTRERNGQVPFAEFKDYYSGISALIDDDAYFEQLLRATWAL